MTDSLKRLVVNAWIEMILKMEIFLRKEETQNFMREEYGVVASAAARVSSSAPSSVAEWMRDYIRPENRLKKSKVWGSTTLFQKIYFFQSSEKGRRGLN